MMIGLLPVIINLTLIIYDNNRINITKDRHLIISKNKMAISDKNKRFRIFVKNVSCWYLVVCMCIRLLAG